MESIHAKIAPLRESILNSDNTFCFIEREDILLKYEPETVKMPRHKRFVFEFEKLMEELSADVSADDILAGRMKEGKWSHNRYFSKMDGGLSPEGHITFDFELILNKGLKGLLEEVESGAEKHPSPNSRFFADCTRRCLEAAAKYAGRYAESARKQGKKELANALETVPFLPAYDFFSAVQSIWFWQFITSTVCGQRDYALGKLDQYLFPFYEADLKSGRITKEYARGLLAVFFLKLNEIAGTATESYQTKPVPCFASIQYITICGDRMNGLTEIIVEAAALSDMKQPTLNFRISPADPESAWILAGKAAKLTSIPNFFHTDLIRNTLIRGGVTPEDAEEFEFTACNRVNLPGKLYNIMRRIDKFNNSAGWFLQALHEAENPRCIDDILKQFRKTAWLEMSKYAWDVRNIHSDGPRFDLDSLAIEECRKYACDKYSLMNPKYRWQHHMFTGIATIGDSLTALQKLVFRSGRYSYKEFMEIVDSDFAGQEALCREIRTQLPHFGNGDPEADSLTAKAVNTLFDAMEDVGREEDFMMFGSLYSLNHNTWQGRSLGATPDGRHAGEPVSENMSPVYGCDKSGPTAMLRSLAALPQERLVCGGLNVKLSCIPDEAQTSALIRSYFQMGGLHMGITAVTRETLEKARLHPDEYKTLCIRKYGFSEYFVMLDPAYQQSIIDRTEY